MGTIVSNSHTLNRVGLFSDFIFVNVNDMYALYLHGIQDILCTL